MTSVLIAGVGGQGSIFSARLLGTVALNCGLSVRGSETIGMAQRGGSVTSHVRMALQDGDTEIASPLIPPGRADVLIALDPAEGERNRHYLREGGLFVCCDAAQRAAVIQRCGAKSLNVALLGVAAALGAFPFGLEELAETLHGFGQLQFAEQNRKALYLGAEMIKEAPYEPDP